MSTWKSKKKGQKRRVEIPLPHFPRVINVFLERGKKGA
jgi:hypothetical protein